MQGSSPSSLCFSTRYRDKLDVFDLPFDARGFSMFAAWHPRSHLDPASLWLRDTLVDVAEHWPR